MTRKTYENEALGVSFSLPEAITVREQLQYRARLVDALGDDAYTRQWQAVLPLIDDWQCDDVPDPAALDLDEPSTWRVGDIVQWTANTSIGHMLELGNVPKKS